MARSPDIRPAVDMMANHKNGAVYTGVTSDLPKRAWEHREGVAEGFTKRYMCKRLVWFEIHSTMQAAMEREKQIKAGSRLEKIELIETTNPDWRDLSYELTGQAMDCFVASLLAMTKELKPASPISGTPHCLAVR